MKPFLIYIITTYLLSTATIYYLNNATLLLLFFGRIFGPLQHGAARHFHRHLSCFYFNVNRDKS